MKRSSQFCALVIVGLCVSVMPTPAQAFSMTTEPENGTAYISGQHKVSTGHVAAPLKQKIDARDRSTIKRSTHSVWYDSDEGTIRPIRSNKPIDVGDRHDSIAGDDKYTAPSWWTAFRNLIGEFLSWIFYSWQIILIVCLVCLLSVVGFLIFKYGLSFQEQFRRMTAKSIKEKEREKVKIQDLPFEVEQTMYGLLAQAERYRMAGDFSKAIIYLFSHALLEMDSARCIRLERGKTNRVYLRELRNRDFLKGFTSQLILAFEYAFFGKHALSKEAFERIWQQLPAFNAYLKQADMKPSDSPSANVRGIS
ncbi:MAG TPA: hypothetical protein VM260_24430 [Pirellula sp.]|nr:hypothetical protein [Pirellula sp.]